MKSTMHMYPIERAAHDLDSADTAWSYRDATWGSVFVGVDPVVGRLSSIPVCATASSSTAGRSAAVNTGITGTIASARSRIRGAGRELAA